MVSQLAVIQRVFCITKLELFDTFFQMKICKQKEWSVYIGKYWRYEVPIHPKYCGCYRYQPCAKNDQKNGGDGDHITLFIKGHNKLTGTKVLGPLKKLT